jgi:hypothetical protein
MQSPDYVKSRLGGSHHRLVQQATALAHEQSALVMRSVMARLEALGGDGGGGTSSSSSTPSGNSGSSSSTADTDVADPAAAAATTGLRHTTKLAGFAHLVKEAEVEEEKRFTQTQHDRVEALQAEATQCMSVVEKLLVKPFFSSALREAQVQSLRPGEGKHVAVAAEEEATRRTGAPAPLHEDEDEESRERLYRQVIDEITDPLLTRLLRPTNKNDQAAATVPSASEVDAAALHALTSSSWQRRMSRMLFGSSSMKGGTIGGKGNAADLAADLAEAVEEGDGYQDAEEEEEGWF